MRLRFYLWILSACMAVFGAGTLATQQPAEKPNYLVLGVTGEWKQVSPPASAEPLQLGDQLTPAPGKDGVCVAGNEEGSIVVWFKEGAVSYACSGEQDANCGAARTSGRRCARWVAPPKQGVMSSATQTMKDFGAYLIAIVAPRFAQQRDQLVVAASRGLEPELNEAVVPVRGPQVDLSPAFREMEPGQYRLWLKPVPPSPAVPAMPSALVTYTKGSPVEVPAGRLKPGLYDLGATSLNGESAGEAWVLVASPEKYDELWHAFEQAVQVTQKWPEDTDPRAARSVLRAYLQALAEQNKK